MAWVAEITGYDPVGAVDTTVRFAIGRGIAFTDEAFCPGGVTRWASATQKVSFDNSGQVVTSGDRGELAILNLPRSYLEAGPLDAMADWAWQGREATFYWVPGSLWSERQLMSRGVLEQPVVDLAVGAQDTSKFRFPIRDPRSALIAPLQTKKFGGTNVGSAGVDGSADLKGRPMPILYGIASNIPPVPVNTGKLIFFLCDAAAEIICVRDGALSLSPGTGRANTASLEATVPIPGTYDWVSGSGGTYIRCGSKPVALLTMDAKEGATSAARTHAQIWKRIRQERCNTSSGDLDIGTVDTDAPDEVGFWWDDGRTQQDAIDEVMVSLSGFEVQDNTGTWFLYQLKAPSGTPVLNFLRLTEDSDLKAIDRPLVNLIRARPNYSTNGAPPFAVNVGWGHNYAVMSVGDFLGAAAPRLRDKFAKEWRVERAEDSAIWDPVANTGLFPNAPELTVNTGYQPGSDGLTSPQAAAEAGRLLTLYSGLPAQYQVDFSPAAGDFVLPGQIVSLTYPGFGLSTSPLFVVLQAGLEVTSQKAVATVVIGFKT